MRKVSVVACQQLCSENYFSAVHCSVLILSKIHIMACLILFTLHGALLQL